MIAVILCMLMVVELCCSWVNLGRKLQNGPNMVERRFSSSFLFMQSERRPLKTSEHTYASWNLGEAENEKGEYVNEHFDSNLSSTSLKRQDFMGFTCEDGDSDESEDVDTLPRDLVSPLRDIVSQVYDSIFFYGIENDDSKGRRTKKYRRGRKSPFFTESEVIGREIIDNPEKSMIEIESNSRDRIGSGHSSTMVNESNKIASRILFLDDELERLEEEINILEVTLAVDDGVMSRQEIKNAEMRRQRLQDVIDAYQIEYVSLMSEQ
jgi:hypothetical protein